MESRQLKYFVAVAEELHFGKAAKRLNISQPPLSQQIKNFEEELGISLFRRNKRSVRLTSVGKSLLPEAKNILNLMEKTEKRLKAASSGVAGSLILGYISPTLESELASRIGEFKKAYPQINLSLEEMPTNRQLEEIRQGRIDAGVVRLFKHETKGLKCRVFHAESYALIVPAGHRLTRKEQVHISDLASEPMIFFPRRIQENLYDEWMAVFSRAGFSPEIEQEVETKNAALALVAAGIGISIVPESLSRRAPEEVVFKSMTGNYPPLEIHIVNREDNDNPALRTFLKLIK